MKRIELVEKSLIKLSADRGVTAGELAGSLELSRANVSNDLNLLCKEGKAEKYGSKPVYYRASETEVRNSAELMLEMFVNNNHSMYHCVEQVKAAVRYPPHGMHMLLFGETGVGKSMFAEMIYKYACGNGYLSENASFTVFNCADYADNPQLLVSQLMGTKKGAYTGADMDRQGLLEKADGGILFLDEVHRLPPQGQEMLFTFIDKGVYRRLGETEAERSATVLIICATTEDPDSNLLKTFTRRIPMMIKIPNLSERSMDERLNLISGFFINESARLGKPISVSVNSVRSLLSYRCSNNIGQLKNDIQIICAKVYSDCVSNQKQELSIVSHDLPDYIREGLYLETTHRQIWSRFVGINKRFCVFDSKAKNLSLQNKAETASIYDMIDARMQDLKNTGVDDEQITKEINNDIQLYFEKYTQVNGRSQDFSNIKNLVGMDVIYVVDQILTMAQEKLVRNYESNIRYGLAIHIYNSINRVKRGQKIVNPQLNNIRKNLSQEFSVALDSLAIISKKFQIDMPIDEAGFLAVFFDLKHFQNRSKVQVAVIAHGKSTATSLVETANCLLGMNCAIGINASLDESPQKVYQQLKELLMNQPQSLGLLLLVDMGSLLNFGDDLQNELGIKTKVIPLVSTLHVIEAARKAFLGYPLEYVYQETLRVNDLLYESKSSIPVKEQLAKLFVITICTTGEGSAALLKDVLDSQLNYHDSICETIALKLTDSEDIRTRLDSISKIGKIVCIVSTFHICFDVPQFSVMEVLEEMAAPKIQKLIDQEASFEIMNQSFSKMLKNDINKNIFSKVRSVIERIEKESGLYLLPDVMIGVLCHMGCMVDRLIEKQCVEKFPNKDSYIQKHSDFFKLVEQSCNVLHHDFLIHIPDDEICYIMTFFTAENCKHD